MQTIDTLNETFAANRPCWLKNTQQIINQHYKMLGCYIDANGKVRFLPNDGRNLWD